jgi:hypothetical protein
MKVTYSTVHYTLHFRHPRYLSINNSDWVIPDTFLMIYDFPDIVPQVPLKFCIPFLQFQ